MANMFLGFADGSLISFKPLLYLAVGRGCVAATTVEVCGWKAGTASSVYMPPVCRWFKLTTSVITTSPVSWVKHTEEQQHTHRRRLQLTFFFLFFYSWTTWPRVSACSHCESKARVLGDVPVPREHGGPPASPWRQARPPEVSVIFGKAKGIGDVKVQQLFKDLQRKKREKRKCTELLLLRVCDGMMIMHERW